MLFQQSCEAHDPNGTYNGPLQIWIPGYGPDTPGEVTVYSGHWANVDEPPVNLFNNANDMYNGVANSRKYALGGRKFSIYGHGALGFIMDEK